MKNAICSKDEKEMAVIPTLEIFSDYV